MTANLYIASYPVATFGAHAYLIYDPNIDGDNNYTTDISGVRILRGGTGVNHGLPLELNVILELQDDVEDSVDWDDAQEATNLNSLDSSLWSSAWNFAHTMGNPNDPAPGLFDSGVLYSLTGPNSNSVINTVLSSVGIDFRDVLPVGTNAASFFGHMDILDASGDDILTAFAYDGGTYTFHDNKGKDYFIVQNGATAEVIKDDNLAEWNNIVLSGYSAAEYSDLYFVPKEGYDLEIRQNTAPLESKSVVLIEDHFEKLSGTSDYNSRYLFVVSDNIQAGDINVSSDTISNTTVHTIIDTHLLDEYIDFWGVIFGVPLEDVKTATIAQPDITGSSSDNYMFGDEFNNIIAGAGGDDLLYGGAGDDTLSVSANSASNYSYVDGGDDIDTFVYTGTTNITVGSNSVTTQSGVAENVEIVQLGTDIYRYVYAKTVGWAYDANNASTLSWVDYSSSSEAMTIDLSQTSWTATQDNTLAQDTFNNASNAAGKFLGTTLGDTITIGDNQASIWLGTGDDFVSAAADRWVGTLTFYYSGGNDIIDYEKLHAPGNIILDAAIQGAEVSFSEINQGPETVYSVGSNLYKDYDFDLLVSISGKGTITLENLTATIAAGADGTFGTSDDSYSHTGPKIELWNGSFYADDGTLIGSGTFDQLDTTPFDLASITGTSANGTMYGFGLGDTIDGALGNDEIRGRGGDDTLSGGEGDDDLYGDLGDDTLNGNNGIDDLYGGMGDDTLNGGDGNDRLYGQGNNDTLDGGLGDDFIYGGFGNDIIYDSDGANRIYGEEGDDLITTGGGNDTIYGDEGNDTISAGAGNDYLYGGSGDDVLDGEDGRNTIYGGAGNDILRTTGAMDTSRLFGEEGDDTLHGGNGNNYLYGGTGTNYFYGGSTSDNSFYLQGGINHIYGGDGVDDFRLDELNFGENIIYNTGTNSNDKISITKSEIYVTDINFEQDGNDLLITSVMYDNAYILAIDHFVDSSPIDYIETNETGKLSLDIGDWILGTTNRESLYGTAGNDLVVSNGGGDNLYGGDGNDELIGSTGNDYFEAGNGTDTIYSGNGNDVIFYDSANDFGDEIRDVGGNDTILLGSSISVSDVSIYDTGSSTLYISAGGNALKLTYQLYEDEFSGIYQPWFIENLEFSNGYIFNLGNYQNWFTYDDSGVTHVGNTNDETIIGGNGDDTLNGDAGNDYIIGNNGNDYITGGFGADTLDGGVGLDTANYSASSLAVEVDLQNGTAKGGHAEGDTLTSIENLVGSDVSTERDWLRGDAEANHIQALDGDDTLSGGAGDDTLEGGSGTDTYLWQDGDGDDTLSDSDGNRDVISLGSGLRPDDLVFTETGSHDLQITFASATGSLTLLDQRDTAGTQQIERIRFDDGSELDLLRYQDWVFGTSSNETITGAAGVDDIQIGLEGNDTLYAYSGNDILLGGAGNDKLYASTGNDELYGGDGDDNLYASNGTTTAGDILVGGYGKDNLQGGYGDTIFYDVLPVDAPVYNPQYDGINDNFDGGVGNDIFIIQVGRNSMQGKEGDDTYIIYFMTDGTPSINTITEVSGADELILPDLDYNDPNWYFTYDPQYADRLLLIYSTAAGDTKIQVNNHFAGYDAGGDAIFGINTFTFGDGTSFDFLQHEVTAGTAATETIYGTAGKDYIVTYAGGDTVYAGDENDYVRGGIDNDTLHGEAGQDFLFGYSGDDTVYGGLGDDRINGEDGADTLYGEEGIDIIRGGTGADYLSGGVGNDTLYGEHDNDTIFGNEGRDKLYGSVGDDLLYGDGDGSETYAGERDVLYGHNGNDTLYGGGGSDYLYGERDDDIIYGGDDNDFIYGEKANNTTWNGNDTLYGGVGNDYIYGNKGTDVLYGQDGADNLWGNAGADTFVFELASAFNGVDNLQDFTVVDGDKLDLSELLTAYDPITDTITDFVQITDAGADSTLSVDMDGGADNFVQIATFKSLTGLDVQYLENNGNLLAA